FSLRNLVQILDRDGPLSLGTNDGRRGSQRDEGDRQARRIDEEGISVGHENRVVAIVSPADQTLAVLHPQESVAGTEVPAPGPLEEVSPQGRHVANLGSTNLRCRLPESRVTLLDSFVLDDGGQQR